MEPIVLSRCPTDSSDFLNLIHELDNYLAICDGHEHAFYAKLNQSGLLTHAVVAYDNHQPVACGALKPFSSNEMEIKRMWVNPTVRRRGIAAAIVNDLLNWTAELGYSGCVLETGLNQPDAITLYRRLGFKEVSKWGAYTNAPNSICFARSCS